MTACEFLKTHEWTQRSYAKDKDGNKTNIADKEAVSFCVLGVLHRVYNDIFEHSLKKEMLRRAIPNIRIAAWNDDPERTKQEVINMLCKLGI